MARLYLSRRCAACDRARDRICKQAAYPTDIRAVRGIDHAVCQQDQGDGALGVVEQQGTGETRVPEGPL